MNGRYTNRKVVDGCTKIVSFYVGFISRSVCRRERKQEALPRVAPEGGQKNSGPERSSLRPAAPSLPRYLAGNPEGHLQGFRHPHRENPDIIVLRSPIIPDKFCKRICLEGGRHERRENGHRRLLEQKRQSGRSPSPRWRLCEEHTTPLSRLPLVAIYFDFGDRFRLSCTEKATLQRSSASRWIGSREMPTSR